MARQKPYWTVHAIDLDEAVIAHNAKSYPEAEFAVGASEGPPTKPDST
jgi:hypothetical protein